MALAGGSWRQPQGQQPREGQLGQRSFSGEEQETQGLCRCRAGMTHRNRRNRRMRPHRPLLRRQRGLKPEPGEREGGNINIDKSIYLTRSFILGVDSSVVTGLRLHKLFYTEAFQNPSLALTFL